ncbi:MAG: putative membrane protein [Spirosomataceae bacterium]|jgi:uncharacterized membrane protein
MKKNMGSTDQIIRVLIAVIIGILYFMDVITGTLGIVLMIVASIFVATSLVSSCPLYSILGMRTCPVNSK